MVACLIRQNRHVRLAKDTQGLIDHRSPHQPAGLAPIISVAVLVQVHKRLLHHIFRRSAVAHDGPGYCQEPSRMLPHGTLKKLVRALGGLRQPSILIQ